jgi:hypothetical protein
VRISNSPPVDRKPAVDSTAPKPSAADLDPITPFVPPSVMARRSDGVQRSRALLSVGSKGADVATLETQLAAAGISILDGRTGTFSTKHEVAVKQFQTETGLPATGRVDAKTWRALDTSKPVRNRFDPWADGRLDVTIAVGFDESAEVRDWVLPTLINGVPKTEVNLPGEDQRGLRQRGFLEVDVEELKSMSPEDRQYFGLQEERFDANATWFIKSDRGPQGERRDTVLRLVYAATNADGSKAKASFLRGLEQDEVVIYAGHGRYGTGPDFDATGSAAGNILLNPTSRRMTDELKKSVQGRSPEQLKSPPGPQLVFASGCETTDWLPALRKSPERMVVATREIVKTNAGSLQALSFLDGVERGKSVIELSRAAEALEGKWLRETGGKPEHAIGLYTTSGLLAPYREP